MNERRSPKNTGKKLLIFLVLGILTAAIALMASCGAEQVPTETGGPSVNHTEPAAQGGAQPVGQEDPQETIQGNAQEGSQQSETGVPQGNTPDSGQDTPSATEGPSSSGGVQQTEPDETVPDETVPPDDQDPDLIVPPPTVVITAPADAEYEQWLAATMVVGLSMEYPDFTLEGIYSQSATALADKLSSEGVCILFTSRGERMAIHSKALERERTTKGTFDISMEHIGFATFDRVDPASLDLTAMYTVDMEKLGELIPQCLLVSVYMH